MFETRSLTHDNNNNGNKMRAGPNQPCLSARLSLPLWCHSQVGVGTRAEWGRRDAGLARQLKARQKGVWLWRAFTATGGGGSVEAPLRMLGCASARAYAATGRSAGGGGGQLGWLEEGAFGATLCVRASERAS